MNRKLAEHICKEKIDVILSIAGEFGFVKSPDDNCRFLHPTLSWFVADAQKLGALDEDNTMINEEVLRQFFSLALNIGSLIDKYHDLVSSDPVEKSPIVLRGDKKLLEFFDSWTLETEDPNHRYFIALEDMWLRGDLRELRKFLEESTV